MKKLYFGDNLEIMREMDDNRVHLICTDPPFNSGRNYNVFMKVSQAQNKAFTDTWKWDTAAEDSRADIQNRAQGSGTYRALDRCLRGYDLVLDHAASGNKGAMRAYLAFMGSRLVEMHRILTEKGSLYLHCDPTASHYLKGLLDAIFDTANQKKNEFFRNEIVWHYRRWTAASKQFQKMHDIILYYTKAKGYVFTKPLQQYADEKYIEDTVRGMVDGKLVRLKDEKGNYIKRETQKGGVLMHDVWTDINFIAPTAKERLGYDTQKPRALYERMIKASSNLNDIVMDPFCGCGTTIDAAHTLNRNWIGVDLTILALDPMSRRMRERHGLHAGVDYAIDGYPTNMQEYNERLEAGGEAGRDIELWAITRLGLKPTRAKSDGGYDGVGVFKVWTGPGADTRDVRLIAEVKSRNMSISDVRAFCHVIEREEAAGGILISARPPTAGIRTEASQMGTFEHIGHTYPRLQFWTIDQRYFDAENKTAYIKSILRLPYEWNIDAAPKSERHFVEEQTEINL